MYTVMLLIVLSASDSNNYTVRPDDKLEWYNKSFPMEKVFLHTDKNIYKAGETIWFKGYILSLTGKRKPFFSNDFYIKLLDQQGEELMYRRYPILNNTITGYLLLPKSTIEGKYFLVAYTGWMKNGDPGYVFKKELVVVKKSKRRLTADFRILNEGSCIADTFYAAIGVKNHTGDPVPGCSIAYTIQGISKSLKQGTSLTDARGIAQIKDFIPSHKIPDACFIKILLNSKAGTGKFIFPIPMASGNVRLQFISPQAYLVRNLENKVYFKSMDKYGLPVCCEGEIVNQAGKAIMSFNTGISGHGSFTFTPLDDVYKARIIVPPGDSLFILPPVRNYGICIDCMGITDDRLSFALRTNQPASIEKTYWISSCLHKKFWSSPIEIHDKTLVEIPIPKSCNGLIQVSVFDEKTELIYDNLLVRQGTFNTLQISTDKSNYGKFERVTARIFLPDTLGFKGNLDLSVSVSQKYLTESNGDASMADYMIFENRLPVLAYKSETPDTNLFLMAGKPFPVDWNKINTIDAEGKDRYYNQDGITGIIYDKRKTPVGYAKVKAIDISNWKSFETQSDESGFYRILFGSDIIDFNYLNINAFDATGKVTLLPSIDEDFSKTVSQLCIVTEENLVGLKIADLYKYQYPDIIATFQYPEKTKKITAHETKKLDNPRQYVNYSNVLDIIRDIKSYEIVNNQLYFKGIPYGYNNQPGALIILDGAAQGTLINVINNLAPTDIVYINILTNPVDIKRYTDLNYPSVVEITTMRGVAQNRMLTGMAGIDILELNRDFYSPDYSQTKPPKDDYRTTLYWNPGLIMPVKESYSDFSFYASGITGIYVIKVQGFDDEGRSVFTQTEFTVRER